MEDLPTLVFHIDQKEFPDLTITQVIDDLWDMVFDGVKPNGDVEGEPQTFKSGMNFVLQFFSSADTNRPRTEKSYPRYWIEISEGNISSELLGEHQLRTSVLYYNHR